MAGEAVIEHNAFIGFFMTLTLYALFGPDMVTLWGNRDIELPSHRQHSLLVPLRH